MGNKKINIQTLLCIVLLISILLWSVVLQKTTPSDIEKNATILSKLSQNTIIVTFQKNSFAFSLTPLKYSQVKEGDIIRVLVKRNTPIAIFP